MIFCIKQNPSSFDSLCCLILIFRQYQLVIKMYLIPLNEQQIYFNTTIWSSLLLQTIYVLSIAYHPDYSQIMYILYGSTHQASNSSNYASLYVLVRSYESFVKNITLPDSVKCNVNCEIKVTSNLFLFQSEMNIVIYPLAADYGFTLTPIFARIKSNFSGIRNYSRMADIHMERYVFVNQSHSIFGSLNGPTYTFPLTLYAQDILDVGLSDNWVFGAVNTTNASLLFYTCVDCIYNGSLGNNSNSFYNQTLLLSTGQYIFSWYRIYKGQSVSNSSIPDGVIFWTMGDILSKKYLINSTNYIYLQSYNNYQNSSIANNDYFLTYGYDLNLIQLAFVQQNYADTFSQFTFDHHLKAAAISDDSSRIAVHNSADSWNVKQYQFVSNCSIYNASRINSTQFCQCYLYDGSQCSLLDKPTSPTTQSLPIGVVIGAVAGIVSITVAVFMGKKYYKRCVKRHRTPWKYNPAEIMSFQI